MPGAYTTEEIRHFTRYGLERHIQLVPDMQSPSHFNWALKHPEFAHLRSDGNNYQACLCDPEAVQFIRDLFGDLIEATPGVEYFHMSMDEVYYAGILVKNAPGLSTMRTAAWPGWTISTASTSGSPSGAARRWPGWNIPCCRSISACCLRGLSLRSWPTGPLSRRKTRPGSGSSFTPRCRARNSCSPTTSPIPITKTGWWRDG